MNVAIYGAGSLGTILGAYLAKNGRQVDLINRNKAHVDALNAHGAQVVGKVNFTATVRALLPKRCPNRMTWCFCLPNSWTIRLWSKACCLF